MEKEDLRKLQLAMLDILKEVDRICCKHNIQYWLTGGTLIGAIRHNGFIPWDDDIDIAMHRADYNKFINIAPQELSSQFYLQNWKTEPNFALCFTKIRKNNTLYMETISEKANIHHGIFIDIFAYDKYPTNTISLLKTKFAMQIISRLMIIKCGFTPWRTVEGSKIWKKIFYVPFYIMAKFINIQSMRNLYQKYVQIANKTNSNHVFNSCEINDEKHPLPQSYLSNFIKHQFEDTQFYIPVEYDKLLRHFYGDYMQLPPPEQREGHHNIVELKLG